MLSSTSKVRARDRRSARSSTTDSARALRRPAARATFEGTSSVDGSAASSASTTVSNALSTFRAISSARAVLPKPGPPTRVRRRTFSSSKSRRAYSDSRSRPTSSWAVGGSCVPTGAFVDAGRAADRRRSRSSGPSSRASARSESVMARGERATPHSMSLTVLVLTPARSASASWDRRTSERSDFRSCASATRDKTRARCRVFRRGTVRPATAKARDCSCNPGPSAGDID